MLWGVVLGRAFLVLDFDIVTALLLWIIGN